MSECPDCGEGLMWAGLGGWVPHTDREHAATRRRLVRYAARLMRERAAVLAGHQVGIWFTQDAAWFVCSCGATGPARHNTPYASGSAHARSDAHTHLTTTTRPKEQR